MINFVLLLKVAKSNTMSLIFHRLRDLTYSAPVYVDVRYTKGGGVQTASHIQIGRIPIMLRSCKCVLAGMSEAQLERAKECVFDPGGYFIVKGVEKVRQGLMCGVPMCDIGRVCIMPWLVIHSWQHVRSHCRCASFKSSSQRIV